MRQMIPRGGVNRSGSSETSRPVLWRHRSALGRDVERRRRRLVGLVRERALGLAADIELALVHPRLGLAQIAVPIGTGEVTQIADVDRLGGYGVAELDRRRET